MQKGLNSLRRKGIQTLEDGRGSTPSRWKGFNHLKIEGVQPLEGAMGSTPSRWKGFNALKMEDVLLLEGLTGLTPWRWKGFNPFNPHTENINGYQDWSYFFSNARRYSTINIS